MINHTKFSSCQEPIMANQEPKDPWPPFPDGYAHVPNVGDVASTEKGSAARYNAGKPDFSLLPFDTLVDELAVWQYGAKKYSRNNWKKGQAWSVPFASLMRHMATWQSGQDNDSETGLPHLAHAMCNLRMLILYAKTYKEGDDRL